MPNKLIILDRDGVINYDSEQFIKSPDEWKPIPGSLEAIARLNQWGWRVVVASNQSGVGRGLFGMDTLNAINEKMVKSLAQVGGRLDAIFFCPHSADSTCDCRKPKPGLFLQIAERFNVSLDRVPAVGDSLRDLQAGVAVGCKPYLVLTGKGAKTRDDPALPEGTLIYPDLAAVVADLTA
ncbi:D-glycero-beta-D-manno-heptose 1,7-bisphosphate 7-phosphatase [Azoarcus sp. DN11]|uniref:D-glycero-beta-D-manno-heptose 1,7-bisphosphate 7-phosphatase n=1 Tax=Azoarcus sp. DN11 TaxID=356837 RepID=UPI000EB4CB09|nr:D-glycero-beta-D-manno-heptose 1,7-bisphosphate 7-phosphatase [Azoarcus sp. DN11]AYH42587.1 D-glycero-beta-D-manno-heptose-1,7-bisphosphate 7-phosphatase [Azoarcus sp. DN11]